MVPNICWCHSTLLTLVVIPNLIHAHAPSRSPGIDIGVSHFRFFGQLPVTFLKLCTTTFYCEFIDTSFVEIGCVVWPGILWREAILYIDSFFLLLNPEGSMPRMRQLIVRLLGILFQELFAIL